MKPGKNIQHPASRLHHNNSEQVKVFVLAFTERSQNSNGRGWYYKPKHLTFVLVPISAHKLSYIFFSFFGELKQTVISFCFQMQAEQHHLFSVLSSEAPNRKKTPEIRFLVFVWVWEWLSSWGRQLMQNVWVLFAAGTKSPLSSLRAGIFYTQSVFRLKTTMKDDANLHHQRVPECVYVCVSVCYEAYIQISKSHAGFVKANDLDRSRLKETKTACCFELNSPSIPHKFFF